jgi:hypothetical protein
VATLLYGNDGATPPPLGDINGGPPPDNDTRPAGAIHSHHTTHLGTSADAMTKG